MVGLKGSVSSMASTVLIALAVLAASAFSAPLLQAREIRLGHNAPTNDPRHESLVEFAALVAERSKGALRVKIFPKNTIGKDRERIEQMQAGLLEMSLTGEILANFDSRWSIISMPYLWRDQDHLRRFLRSDTVSVWKAETARTTGLRVLGFIERNPRILTTREKPIDRLEDLRGLRIRVPKINAYMDTWRAFGVEPKPMSSSEFFLALKSGAVDGMENPIEVMSSWKIYEVSKYLTFTNHMLTRLFLVASARFMDSITPEQREIVEQAAGEIEKRHALKMTAMVEGFIRNLEAKGMILNRDPDLAAFKRVAKTVHIKYMNAFGRAAYDFATRQRTE